MLLNFGHTIGHAIERCYGYGYYTHGEGVAAGMAMLTGVTEHMGLTEAGTTERLCKVLRRYGLPTDVQARQMICSVISATTKETGQPHDADYP